MGFKRSKEQIEEQKVSTISIKMNQHNVLQTQTYRFDISCELTKLAEVGDQQQLPPPVALKVLLTKSGGMSCLDYFTQGDARISNTSGIFFAYNLPHERSLDSGPEMKNHFVYVVES